MFSNRNPSRPLTTKFINILSIAVIPAMTAITLTIPTSALAQNTSKSNITTKSGSSESAKTSNANAKSKSTKSSTSSKSKSDSAPSSKPKPSTSDDSQTVAANQPILPQSFNDQMLSELVFDLTNAERIRAGLRPFENNPHLAASATAHSRDMANRNYFNHKSKGLFNRTNPHDRIASAGYSSPRMTAENIAMIPSFNSQRIQSTGNGNQVVDIDYNSYNRMATYALKQWMESKGHRENILNRNLTELGVGVAIGLRDNVPYVYLTQNFGG